MTKFVEFPLRPQGQPWPGLNTKGGRLDPGQGYLEDGSFNAIINENDILQKRKGLIRGLDERFDGVVCGLFRYTDECGNEYVVVADQTGIFVRTPFDIPTFLGSDSIPNDDFETLDTTRWSPTVDYTVFLSNLQLDENASLSSDAFVEESRLMVWFKDSALTSYQVEIQYAMVNDGDGQVVSVAIKKTGTTYLQANVYLNPGTSTYQATLEFVNLGSRTTLGTADLGGAGLANGFLRLSYNAETRTATARVIPSGGSQASLSATLNELQDASLGQQSAIGIAHAGEDEVQIETVTGGSISGT